MEIDQNILEAVNLYGPFAVLFLLVMPLMGEDIIIIPAGFLIGQGHLPVLPTFVCAYIGAFISDSMWYLVCHRYGTPLLHKRWFKRLAHPRRLLQAKHQIETRGAWLIVTSRFVPGSRTTTMIVAGLMHMPLWKFILAEGSLLLVTVGMQLGLGYLISQHIVASKGAAATIMSIIGLVVLLIAGAIAINWITSSRKSEEPSPRSRVAWLKRFRPRVKRSLRMHPAPVSMSIASRQGPAAAPKEKKSVA
jgi:membrane protein DedA with SNARE-associated domain